MESGVAPGLLVNSVYRKSEIFLFWFWCRFPSSRSVDIEGWDECEIPHLQNCIFLDKHKPSFPFPLLKGASKG